MSKKILLATSLISLFTLADAQKPVTKQEFINVNRFVMYQIGFGLPQGFHDPEWDNVGFSKPQKQVLKAICLKGKYNPKNGDAKYVSPIWADSLLEMYHWN
ncbi:hypothetical protein COU59_02590 [Candidatus Pacearchaeota archaeon CG10_big_fil_rev_8_21_14_0_10_34_12]|nr:MAG: hypothetical protein COU59_02590 [Candidatus Pacearchaeota archaeon CG10_big_fil_rev_8_21_14_0_10_34_12]